MTMTMSKNSVIFSFIFLPFISSATTQLAPALYVFGDSLLDSGNNNFLPTVARANYLPYGANFVNRSTGRFTNGKTVADFIAEFLGLPYSPPFLSYKRDLLPLTGLNYASGSCGILPETGSPFGQCLNFEEQVGLFQDSVKSLQQRYFQILVDFSNYLSKSVFIVSIGSNDYINNYLETSLYDTSKRYTPQQFAQLLVYKLSQQLERLYNLGARKIVVFELGPIGCLPWITRNNKHTGQCVEDTNQIVSYFNNMLPAMLQNLTTSLKGSNFINGHGHGVGYDAIINPSKYGIADASNPCCTAFFNGTSGCIPYLRPCNNTNKHYFWDGYHPTEDVYSILASGCINNASFCTPHSLKDLVKV
ncbi:GDSL esterase/lipase 7 [Citrus sinensis]|uniref:GDSL esterase/lipase 7-like n=1 Tax=Citrus sinensis TaxID=2711 RepID=UPI0003D719A6|nr:GDSL esterase/lipase 7-like [Citrus sinensis]KAH9676131.1 GDSL esterase/lipase 7 [Citrus sinensis]